MPHTRQLWRALSALMLAVAAVAWGLSTASADTYVVQPGDTLSGIAYHLQIDVSVILALNEQIASPDNIYVGQILHVPDNSEPRAQSEPVPAQTGTAAASGGRSVLIYEIQPGDTLSEIGSRFSIDIESLLELNPGLNPNVLYIGYGLLVRKMADEPAASPSAASPSSSSSDSDSSPALTAGAQARELGSTATRTIEYVVQSNDYASDIADAHGITLELLQQRNPDVSLEVIHPGQVLLIPIPDYRAPAIDPSDTTTGLTDTYTVRAGDSATAIANRYEITLANLRELNDGINLSTIFIGQRLVVPWVGTASDEAPGTVPAVEVRNRSHRVQPGDTFASVASFYGLTMEELRSLNPMRPSDLLVVGERLILPGTIEPPVVAESRMLWEADLVQYAAASLGVTPHTLLANYPWLSEGDWMSAGSSWRLPLREGQLITVQPGDTLQSIANAHGVSIDLFLNDTSLGVDDPNALVIGQEIILPLNMPYFGWPAHGEITDPFGLCRSWDCSYRHRGLDLALDYWEPIMASADGTVTFVGGDPYLGLGWYVEVDHGHGWKTVYAHLVEFNVWQGQTVSRGDVVGYNGNTGYSTGPHLHFEVHHDDWYIDPLVVLP